MVNTLGKINLCWGRAGQDGMKRLGGKRWRRCKEGQRRPSDFLLPTDLPFSCSRLCEGLEGWGLWHLQPLLESRRPRGGGCVPGVGCVGAASTAVLWAVPELGAGRAVGLTG